MTGTKIERGGKTASSYIVNTLADSLERLSGIGFGVKMTVYKNSKDYQLFFQRIRDRKNVTQELDVQELENSERLVFEFYTCAFNDKTSKKQIASRDLRPANDWLEKYGYEKSLWIMKRCVELHKQAYGAKKRIYSFKGLSLYEMAAVSDYNQSHAVQDKGGSENAPPKFNSFHDVTVAAHQAWAEYIIVNQSKLDAVPAEKRQEIEINVKAQTALFEKNVSSNPKNTELYYRDAMVKGLCEAASLLTKEQHEADFIDKNPLA
jgi:hypothetical protein